MPVKIVAEIDTSGEGEISVTFISMEREGATAEEKLFAGKAINAMARDVHFPKISGLDAAGASAGAAQGTK